MIHSKMCLLHKLDPIKLSDFGECPYDHGGYFIIKGKEKVILSQEKKINDILYINSINDELMPMQCVLKTISTEGFQSSRTNTINFVINKLREKIEGNTIIRKEKTFNVRILGFDVEVPLLFFSEHLALFLINVSCLLLFMKMILTI